MSSLMCLPLISVNLAQRKSYEPYVLSDILINYLATKNNEKDYKKSPSFFIMFIFSLLKKASSLNIFNRFFKMF